MNKYNFVFLVDDRYYTFSYTNECPWESLFETLTLTKTIDTGSGIDTKEVCRYASGTEISCADGDPEVPVQVPIDIPPTSAAIICHLMREWVFRDDDATTEAVPDAGPDAVSKAEYTAVLNALKTLFYTMFHDRHGKWLTPLVLDRECDQLIQTAKHNTNLLWNRECDQEEDNT